jgi:L-asparaginase / beta-aspartyl-peptidase
MARWAIAIHGGAGVDPNLPEQSQEEAKRVLARCLQVGVDALRAGSSALDVVEAVVRELETDPFFNSGRGSALTRRGTVEMEASIMDGRGRRCGAVSGVSTVKNPVSLARRVMDGSPHSYLAFQGAEEFARDQVNLSILVKRTNPLPILRINLAPLHESCMHGFQFF